MTEKIDLQLIQQKLAAWFATQLPQATEITVSSLKMPGAGSSNETFLFHLDRREGGTVISQNLVIRWKPKGFLVFPEDSYDMKQQFLLQQCLAGTPVPAPPVYWLEEDPAVIGAPFYIMERVDGWIPGDFPPYHVEGKLFDASEADRVKTWLGVVDTMVEIHTLDWRAAGLEFLGVPQGKDFINNQVAFWDRVFAQNNEPMPAVLASTRQWLLDNSFTPRHLTLTWGDARLGNTIFRDYEVVAALDWEMACIGDPEADLAWFAHVDWASSAGRASSPLPRLAGLPSIEETIAHYERATDRKVENFHYYDVFAAWRLALVYTRIEQDEKYLARSGNRKGFLTGTHYQKLKNLIGI